MFTVRGGSRTWMSIDAAAGPKTPPTPGRAVAVADAAASERVEGGRPPLGEAVEGKGADLAGHPVPRSCGAEVTSAVRLREVESAGRVRAVR